MDYLEKIDETIHEWFCSLTFIELEKIFCMHIFGLNEEDSLNGVRDEFYSLDREEKLELIVTYYNK